MLLFLRSDADYYEDVLQNAETAFAAKNAAKEGKIATPFQRRVKVRDTGPAPGLGRVRLFL